MCVVTQFRSGRYPALKPVSSRRYLVTKRVLDLAIGVPGLVVILPLFAICALAIRLDSRGKAIFAQTRTGRDGRPFRMYKFRTMVSNAEELKPTLAHLNVLPPPDFKIINDPRITRVGRLLRKTSLDELPQIINLIKGEMSLVGPRPTSFAPSTYDLWHTRRLEVTPGITGLWQVKGRNATTFDERLRLDIKYIESMSVLLDLKILWWTLPVVFRGEGA